MLCNTPKMLATAAPHAVKRVKVFAVGPHCRVTRLRLVSCKPFFGEEDVPAISFDNNQLARKPGPYAGKITPGACELLKKVAK